MPFTPNAPIDLALKERIRVAYYDEELPVDAVAMIACVGKSTLYRWFEIWGWPLRRPMLGKAGARAPRPARQTEAPAPEPARSFAPQPEGEHARPAPKETLKARLTRLVEHRIAVLENDALAGRAVDPEENARAIALNARTLMTLERLADPDTNSCPNCRGEDGRPPRSIAELRDDLYAHLVRIANEGRAERGELLEEEETCSAPPEEAAATWRPGSSG